MPRKKGPTGRKSNGRFGWGLVQPTPAHRPKRCDVYLIGKLDLCDIRMFNDDAKRYGTEPIKLKIRKCIACRHLFESRGDRACGCTNSARSMVTSPGCDILGMRQIDPC